MAVALRFKRRWTGAAGAPASLKSGEPAFNGVDETLYMGFGDNGAGEATSIAAIGGKGAVVMLTGIQTVEGEKFFSLPPRVPTLAPGDSSDKAASTAFVAAAVAGVTLGPKSVQNSKLADMPAYTMKGNNAGSAGSPADLTVSQIKSLLSISNIDNTSDLNKPISNAVLAALNAKADKDSPSFTGIPTVPTASPGTTTGQAASTEYVVNEIAARLAAADAMTYKGALDASANPNYPAADCGHTYRVGVAGRIGGPAGAVVEVGDLLMCRVDGSAAGLHAAVGSNWDIIQTNIDGALTNTDIGTKVQAYSAKLAAFASLVLAADRGIYATAANTLGVFVLTAGGRALGAAAGTAGTFPYFSAANTVASASISAAGRALVAASDVAAQRGALGLGSLALQSADNVSITGGVIDGVTLDGGTY